MAVAPWVGGSVGQVSGSGSDPPEQLLGAIRTVAAGDALLSPAITRRVIRQFTGLHRYPPPPVLETLTQREMDVFRPISQGMSNAEIGREPFIGDPTVKTHVTRLLQKLEVRDRAQAIVLACQGVVDGTTP